MSERLSPVDRYQSDAHFRQLVDMLYSAIDRADFTPTEIREAAMFAQIKYEELRLRPLILDSEWALPGRR